jgi:hypothetical protein
MRSVYVVLNATESGIVILDDNDSRFTAFTPGGT